MNHGDVSKYLVVEMNISILNLPKVHRDIVKLLVDDSLAKRF